MKDTCLFLWQVSPTLHVPNYSKPNSPAQIAGELGSRCAFNPNTQEAETGKISEVKASLV